MFLFYFLLLVFLFVAHQFWWRRRNLPPNEPRWEDVLLKWKQTYGPIYSFWTAGRPSLAVASFDAAHRLFVQQGDAFVDRGMPESALKLTRGGPFGIVFNSGDLWREQRRFALSTLRNFGLDPG
ncbi:Cytochrome P450 [Aphelenchoides fujianensis]|nr:Cytochrome P450 [Aphelenchoides fujianensis]